MASNPAAAKALVCHTGTPYSAPTPARPLNSVASAPTQLTASVASNSTAGHRPSRCRASSANPCRVASPRREASSCAMNSAGISANCSSNSR